MVCRRRGLKAARLAARVTLEGLAESVGVDRSTVVRWEGGRTKPYLRHRKPLADALGVSVDEVDVLIDGASVGPAREAKRSRHGGRLAFVVEQPASVDLVSVAELRERVRRLDAGYATTPSALLVGDAGQRLGQAMLLKTYATGRVHRELLAAEAEAATLMGQLVWDACQRQDQSAARQYFQQAAVAARQVGDPATEGLAYLRQGFLALYGERDPAAGLVQVEWAAEVARRSSRVVAGLGLLHVAEALAMSGDRSGCERSLTEAESWLGGVADDDPAFDWFDGPTQIGRLAGSCYLSLGDWRRAQRTLEETAAGYTAGSKNKAIVLGNLALAHVGAGQMDEAVGALHEALDVLEATRGGGGFNVVFDAGRKLQRWSGQAEVQDVNDRLLRLVAAR